MQDAVLVDKDVAFEACPPSGPCTDNDQAASNLADDLGARRMALGVGAVCCELGVDGVVTC